jgi:hypothetical protein
VRNVELRQALKRYIKRKHGHQKFLRDPTLTALGDALWVLCEGNTDRLPEVMTGFLQSIEAFDEEVESATFVLIEPKAECA